MMVNPSVNSNPGAPAASTISRTGTGSMTVRLIASCYGTNLRSVSNPLSPASEVEAKLSLNMAGEEGATPTKINLSAKFPGQVADKAGITAEATGTVDPSKFTGPAGTGMRIYGNTVELSVPMPIEVEIEADGDTVPTPIPPVSLDSYSFRQEVKCGTTLSLAPWGFPGATAAYNCGAYMAKTGQLTTKFQNVAVSADNSNMEIAVAFPGQNGFCGGFFSPLMLFFDNNRPSFSGSSQFKLSSRSDTHWVEAGHPGYFLAIDRNKNGKIDGKDELFGDQDANDSNGFDSLTEFDTNSDGIIDAKDKDFKKLLLWQDKNGDGVSQKNELSAMHKRVVKISLAYRRINSAYSGSAEARQVSQFWFKEGKATKTGSVEDIWFAPLRK